MGVGVGGLSTDTVGQVSTDTITLDKLSVDILPASRRRCRSSIGRGIGRVSPEMSAECRPIVSVDTRREIGRVSAEMWPIVLVECQSSVGRVSADISTDILHRHTPPTYSTDILDRHSRPTSWPTLGREIDRHWVEHQSTCSSSW